MRRFTDKPGAAMPPQLRRLSIGLAAYALRVRPAGVPVYLKRLLRDALFTILGDVRPLSHRLPVWACSKTEPIIIILSIWLPGDTFITLGFVWWSICFGLV